jgi:hypothetical protein
MSVSLRSKRDSLVNLQLQQLHEALAAVGVREPVRPQVESLAQQLIAREAQHRALQARSAPETREHSPLVRERLSALEALDEELLQRIPPLVSALRRAGDGEG